jgi:tRNA threonylcarbamoyladenosine biosynthesis protein TsaE
MATFISHSAADTAELGESWGRAAQRGLIIGLSGDLGAGKTELVKGIARGLGVMDRVHSPTFALVNTYGGGRFPLHHLDLYRLETIEQILSAGLEEYLHSDGVTVIEWIERWFGEVRSQSYSVRSTAEEGRCKVGSPTGLSIFRVAIETLSESERRIVYEDTRA